MGWEVACEACGVIPQMLTDEGEVVVNFFSCFTTVLVISGEER